MIPSKIASLTTRGAPASAPLVDLRREGIQTSSVSVTTSDSTRIGPVARYIKENAFRTWVIDLSTYNTVNFGINMRITGLLKKKHYLYSVSLCEGNSTSSTKSKFAPPTATSRRQVKGFEATRRIARVALLAAWTIAKLIKLVNLKAIVLYEQMTQNQNACFKEGKV